MVKIKYILIIFLTIFILKGAYYFLFMISPIIFNYNDFIGSNVNKLGGVVFNETDHCIKVLANDRIVKIPPRLNSRDIGLWDADKILITRPIELNKKIYTSGLVKFCDFSTIKISSKNNYEDKIKTSLSYNICKLFKKAGWRSIHPYEF